MNRNHKQYGSFLRLTSLVLSVLLLAGTCSICAVASDIPAQTENSALAALLEEPLPEIEPAGDYIVRYSDAAVGSTADEGEHWDCLDGEALEAALDAGTVVYYEEDAVVTLLDDSTTQWEHSMIQLEAMEQIHADGTGIVIGVLDSGIYPHAELSDCLLPGYNYVDGNEDTTDTYGHGTKVAGILAAACDGTGVSGIAPGAKLVPLKAFDERNTSISNLVAAIYGAVDTYHVDIINMSFGTYTNSGALEYMINYAASQGVIMIAAAGNDGNSKLQYPAAYDAVIGVGSIREDGSHAASSQRNESVYISAPGVLVTTTAMDGGYDTCSGTSFATPMVTGAIADLLSMAPDLTAEEIRTVLAETATDAGATGYDSSYGWGILNLQGARAAILGDSALYLAPLGTAGKNGVTASITCLSGDCTDVTLVTTVTNANGTLTAASTQMLTMDPSGTLTATVTLPSDIAADTLLPANFSKLSGQRLTLENGSIVRCYAVQTGTCFRDVTSDQYYFDSVHWAAENGITCGTGGLLFSPSEVCTRAQIVTFLWRLAGCPEATGTADAFSDVPEGSYYEAAVLWAVENGIVYGTDASHFSPDTPCTRAQIVSLLWRAAGNPASSGTKTFSDVPEGSYYEAAVRWAAGNGIVSGVDSTHFAPEQPCTRCQAVSLLYRYASSVQ